MKLWWNILLCLCTHCFAPSLTANPCVSQMTCGDCIRADSYCAWCSQKDFDARGKQRCDYFVNHLGPCINETDIIFPLNRMVKMKDQEISNKGIEVIQMKPQAVKLSLRPNLPFSLRFTFQQTEDYPIDLYYVMDLSDSMTQHKSKLFELGNRLSEEMRKITSNFKLGIGSFANKVTTHDISSTTERLKGECVDCPDAYGFLNHMSLTSNHANFVQQVREALLTAYSDAPESGSDAIMQALVCEGQIGWRENSRKILVFSSSRDFLSAEDGELKGILKPNDGYCHLDAKGYYTESGHQHYPSLSQINREAVKKKINIIFAVTATRIPMFKRITKFIEGSSVVELKNDSSNVVDLVKDLYNQITSEIEMKDNASSYVQVTYYSSCLWGKEIKTNVCKGLRIGTNVELEVKVEVTSCPKDPKKWKEVFQVYPVGIKNALTIDLEMICECDCEKPWNEERNSVKCSNGHGTYKCGICSCYDGRFGERCECGASDVGLKPFEECTYGNDSITCSGRGTCMCGACECYPRSNPEEMIYGKYCECDNYSCDRNQGKICSGFDHGICECGICLCKPGWIGHDCGCQVSSDTCIGPNGEICSGRGSCECGICKCDGSARRCAGPFCEHCL